MKLMSDLCSILVSMSIGSLCYPCKAYLDAKCQDIDMTLGPDFSLFSSSA